MYLAGDQTVGEYFLVPAVSTRLPLRLLLPVIRRQLTRPNLHRPDASTYLASQANHNRLLIRAGYIC